MDPTQIPVFQALKQRMSFLNARAGVLAENVANVSTPGFVPRDLDTGAFEAALQSQLARTGAPLPPALRIAQAQAGVGGQATAMQFTPRERPGAETTLDGNGVIVEEEMMKVSQTRMDYEAAAGLYQKALSLLRMAARAPGR